MNFLIDLGIKATVALSVAFLVAWALRKGSASVRYAMWTCALAALLTLPLAVKIGPAWNMRVASSAWSRATGVSQAEHEAPSISVVVQARRPAPVSWPEKLPMTIWIAGVVAMLARVGLGHCRVRSLFRAAGEIRDPQWLALVEDIGLGRSVVLKRSMATDVPLSYGLFQPTVLLPGDADQWSEERRRIVLSHETVHARRLDLLWGMVAQCALAVNWFNPLAWLAAKQFRREQERSCDDAVVTAGTASAVYAAHLVDVARAIAMPEAALSMADGFDLEGRVHALLDTGRNRKAVSRPICIAMLAGAVVLMAPLAAIRAQTGPQEAPQPATAIAPPSVQNTEGPKKEVSRLQRALQDAVRAQTASAAPQATFVVSVHDPSGAAVPRAMLSLKRVDIQKANEEVALTDAEGRHQFQIVADANYWVKVTAPGFETEEMGISADAGRTATADFALKIGEVRENIEIVGNRPQPAEAAAVGAPRTRVGGMVQAIKLISKVEPAYPADAQAEGVEGTVLLRAVVSKNGSLLHIKPVNDADQRLVNAAIAAVSLWQYQPTLLNGEPVEVITTIAVTFRLN